jgi:CRISPR-associated protein Csb1
VHADGTFDRVEVDRETARNLYTASLESAQNAGFKLTAEPIRLTPQEKLVEIVRRSQDLALEGEGGEADEGDK